MTEIQIDIIDRLKANRCNISDSISDLCRLDDYYEFLKDPDFAAGVAESKQIQRDFVLSALMDLVESGDKTAITDYQRMERQAGDASDLKKIKKEFMRVCIELADVKSLCLKEYCAVFNASSKASEKQYDSVVKEYNLITPWERAKLAQKQHKESLSTMFDNNELSEIDMYSRMLSRSLQDSEASEHPGERSKARADVISINQRLEEINERIRRESEEDDTNLFNKLDAILARTTPDKIDELKEQIMSKGIECS